MRGKLLCCAGWEYGLILVGDKTCSGTTTWEPEQCSAAARKFPVETSNAEQGPRAILELQVAEQIMQVSRQEDGLISRDYGDVKVSVTSWLGLVSASSA